jgi:adenosylcobinamide-phosphate synthase
MGPVKGGAGLMALVLAMVLDALLGEPKWLWSRLPHPAVVIGRAVGVLDARMNDDTRGAGAFAVSIMLVGAIALGLMLMVLPGIWAEVIVGAVLLAQKSLVEHVQRVGDALRLSLGEARRAVAMIVGRDVRDMDAPAVARGAIESAAIGGLPGLLAYKIVNTADSMIGYRTPKYENFGWAAAKLDDILNWIPARLTALLIWGITRRGSWGNIAADASLHRSPNAGWPEAAMAPALGVSLSGPRSYDGVIEDFDWVHAEGRKDAGPDDIDGAVDMLWKAWALGLALAAMIALI